MARATQSTRPYEVLSDAIRQLEAVALVCMASPKKKPVHQLRTWTRRIEAQLELIALLPDAPPAASERKTALRMLKKLRRQAGRVRDLDVQRELVARESLRAKGSSRGSAAMRKSIKSLRRDLKERRDKEARALLDAIKGKRKKLPRVLAKLRETLGPLKDTALAEGELVHHVRNWYARCKPQQQPPAPGHATKGLHSIRKRAKHARYMAESAPKTAMRAHRLAARFEALQQAGGHWHDWLQLCQLARKELGESEQLSQRFSAHAASALRTYKGKLAAAHTLTA